MKDKFKKHVEDFKNESEFEEELDEDDLDLDEIEKLHYDDD